MDENTIILIVVFAAVMLQTAVAIPAVKKQRAALDLSKPEDAARHKKMARAVPILIVSDIVIMLVLIAQLKPEWLPL